METSISVCGGNQMSVYERRKKENLLLSHDGEIALYKVNPRILKDFHELLKEFYRWEKTNSYD
jgi:hypothetical protein